MSLGITYERLDPSVLKIDRRVQRELDPRRVALLALKGFDPAKLGTITVSRRMNGDLVLLNGQHRIALAADSGHAGPFMAEIHHGLTIAEEASLFLGLNDQTTPSALSKFLVRITEGDKVAIAINNVVASHGWRIAQGSNGMLPAVDALERVYRTAARTLPESEYEDILDHVLTVVTRSWGHVSQGVHQSILQGIAQIYGRFGSAVDSGKLIADLQKHSPAELLGRAKQVQAAQGGTVPAAFAKVLVGIHNNRKRTNLLPEWVWTR